MKLFVYCVIGVMPFLRVEKEYAVVNTRLGWVRVINSMIEIQSVIRQSDLPANKAFWCDSVLNAYINDINQQVYSAMKAEADTIKHKNK